MDPKKDPLHQIYRIIVGLISIGFLYVIWPYISSVVVMLVFAFLFTTILLPGVDTLERRIKSRGLSVLIVTLLILGLIGFFIGSFISQMSQQASDFSKQIDQATLAAEFKGLAERFSAALPSFVGNFQVGGGDFADKLSGMVNSIVKNLASLLETIGNFLFIAVMTLIFTIILLHEYHNFKRALVKFISNKYFEIGLRLVFNIERSVSSYLRGQLLAASSVGIMSIIGLVILNLLGANLTLIIFIGIIAGLANLIPLVGPFVGMIPAIMIAFMNNLGNETALQHELFGLIPSPFFILDIVLMFIIVQQIEGNLITPTLVGKSVGLHPMMVMIALIIGGTILGPMGMLFAVPAAGVTKVIIQEVTLVRQYAHLL